MHYRCLRYFSNFTGSSSPDSRQHLIFFFLTDIWVSHGNLDTKFFSLVCDLGWQAVNFVKKKKKKLKNSGVISECTRSTSKLCSEPGLWVTYFSFSCCAIGKLYKNLILFVLTALMKTSIWRQWLIPWWVPSMTVITATPWLFPFQASAVIFH